MYKELIICIIIIVLIFIGNAVTQKFTDESIYEASSILNELRNEIIKEDDEVNYEFAKKQVNLIHEKWDKRYEKLAYFIEHDELEKVETELTGLRGYIEKQEYTEALAELDKSVYILEHINQKNDFKLKNIF